MGPILTLTMNPALDLSTAVTRVRPKDKLRGEPPRVEPGGGGINVARVVTKLGGDAHALYVAGGHTGDALEALLGAEGVSGRRIPVDAPTRQNVTVFERATHDQYRFVLTGDRMEAREWERVLSALGELARDARIVVASGSLPPGPPDDFYARAATVAAEAGARFVLDTSGPALRHAVDAPIYLLKPNLRELADLGVRPEDPEGVPDAARALLDRHPIEIVAVSMGVEGVYVVTRDDAFHVRAPSVEARSAVGAGDSFVGGVVHALAAGRSLADAVCWGTAAGAATLLTPGTELCRREDVERIAASLRDGERAVSHC